MLACMLGLSAIISEILLILEGLYQTGTGHNFSVSHKRKYIHGVCVCCIQKAGGGAWE